MFKQITGQKKVIDILTHASESRTFSQSYLFHGPDGVGKFLTALYFGMSLNCLSDNEFKPCGVCSSCQKMLNFSHPDFTYIFPSPNLKISPEGQVKDTKLLKEYEAALDLKRTKPWKEYKFSGKTEIRIDMIHMLQHRINISPNESFYKIYIIEHADMMNKEAANAFLKTLEEPPEDSLIILTSSKPHTMLPTILSRCQKISFQSLSEKIIEEYLINRGIVSEKEARQLARIANGNMEKARQLAEDGVIESRQSANEFIRIFYMKHDLEMIHFAEKIKNAKSRYLLMEIIDFLIVWLSDLNYFIIDENLIANRDQCDIYEHLYGKNPLITDVIPKIIREAEEMKSRIAGNVNIQLAVSELYFLFRERLRH